MKLFTRTDVAFLILLMCWVYTAQAADDGKGAAGPVVVQAANVARGTVEQVAALRAEARYTITGKWCDRAPRVFKRSSDGLLKPANVVDAELEDRIAKAQDALKKAEKEVAAVRAQASSVGLLPETGLCVICEGSYQLDERDKVVAWHACKRVAALHAAHLTCFSEFEWSANRITFKKGPCVGCSFFARMTAHAGPDLLSAAMNASAEEKE